MAFQSKERIRQRWLWSVEDMVKKACPELAGRMDWDTAIYLFNTGVRNIEAAERLIALHKRQAAYEAANAKHPLPLSGNK